MTTLYETVGGDQFFERLVDRFYEGVAGDEVLLEQEYYSVGGGFIEWKGYVPPKKNAPKYPFRTMKELRVLGLIRTNAKVHGILNWDALQEMGEFDPTYLQLRRSACP